jgi:GntR family transcriptional regulator
MNRTPRPHDPRLPRYQQIRDDIAGRVTEGEWTGGDCLPSEAELALSYGVSVGTIRKAVDRLEADGIVERMQGRGMFVRRADFANSLFRFFRLGSEGEKPLMPEGIILERGYLPAPSLVRDRLQLGANARSVRMIRLRRAGDRTLLREEIWLPGEAFAGIVELDEAELMPLLYPAYERHFCRVIARARERLSVDVADHIVAHDLGISEGDTIVRVERLAFDHQGKPIEWRVSHGPAAHFVYEADVQ